MASQASRKTNPAASRISAAMETGAGRKGSTLAASAGSGDQTD